MKLSIIIPVYNGEKFILRSYKSILNQNIEDIDYEILYINNNSTDNSEQIIRILQQENSQIKLYNQTKQGEAQARNMGIEKASGDYLYQLDVDDQTFPSVLNRMIKVLDKYPEVDAVFGKMYKTNKTLATINIPSDQTHEVLIKEKPYWGLKWFSDLGSVVGEGAFMHRRKVFETIGCYTEELPIIGTDLAFDIKLGMLCNIAYLDTYIYLYFKHDISLIQGVKKKMPRAFMVWPRLVKEHLPFYFSHKVPKRFEILLFSQLFQSLGRQITFTEGITKRFQLKKQLFDEIAEVEIPLLIRVYLTILVVFPFSFNRKIYGYYIVPYAVKRIPSQKPY
ncbi:glycosyltransferase family 2 protein [Hanstruepera ponticola]|uniref:glycosyltransferase family 2 protein n=1 Tax=Hanstruepera ponticola TaxID=2042995 RepID=UPI000CF145C3|nr:glycosyltransferase family 2 protein [Hanstruepera ponticola]